MRLGKWVLGVTAALVVLAGCSGDKTASSGTTGSTAPSGGAGPLVGIVFDSGGIGDKSFNDSANAGIKRAEKELGTTSKTVDSKSAKDYETNLTALADGGCKIIFAVGFAQKDALQAVAPKYPDVKFAIIDDSLDLPNVRSLRFTEEQGSFLAGYLAGKMTKTNKIGFIGGQTTPLIKKFESGYIAGAKTANPKIEVLPAKYIESWDDTGLAKTSAQFLYSNGADVVYHAAGRAGLGVIAAAKDAGKYAIGVDSDQDGEAPGSVLTSMIKHVDNAVFATIKDVKDGSFKPGTTYYDLKADGVGLSEMKYTKDKIPADVLKALDDVKKKIIDGTIKVPATEEELKSFQAPK